MDGARSGSCRPAAFAQMEDMYEAAGEKLVMGLVADTTPVPEEMVAFGWLELSSILELTCLLRAMFL